MTLEWRRYGAYSAHLWIDGAQSCTTAHGTFKDAKPKDPNVVTELDPESGEPYGKVCRRCRETFREAIDEIARVRVAARFNGS